MPTSMASGKSLLRQMQEEEDALAEENQHDGEEDDVEPEQNAGLVTRLRSSGRKRPPEESFTLEANEPQAKHFWKRVAITPATDHQRQIDVLPLSTQPAQEPTTGMPPVLPTGILRTPPQHNATPQATVVAQQAAGGGHLGKARSLPP